jgi:hypothetical protein
MSIRKRLFRGPFVVGELIAAASPAPRSRSEDMYSADRLVPVLPPRVAGTGQHPTPGAGPFWPHFVKLDSMDAHADHAAIVKFGTALADLQGEPRNRLAVNAGHAGDSTCALPSQRAAMISICWFRERVFMAGAIRLLSRSRPIRWKSSVNCFIFSEVVIRLRGAIPGLVILDRRCVNNVGPLCSVLAAPPGFGPGPLGV